MNHEIDGKPAILIPGTIIETRKNNRTKKMATFVKINGKEQWMPYSMVREHQDGLLINKWFYETKMI